MKQAKSPSQFESLQNIFADISSNTEHDPIERIVVLTYEFDDQQLLNLLSRRRLEDEAATHKNDLRFIANSKPVVIYDASKTRAVNQLPPFLERIPVRAARYSCHHAKAYLIVTKNTIKLILGSFNLTRTGLFTNREVFMDFSWSRTERGNMAVLRSFAALLANGYASHHQAANSAALKSAVTTLESRLSDMEKRGAVASAGPAYQLLASGYADGKAGLPQLAKIWRTISSQPPCKLLAISPFFDRGQTFLADKLHEALGVIGDMVIYTDAENTELSKQHYGKTPGVRSLHCIPKEIGGAELKRIAAANDAASVDHLQIARALHAKILILFGAAQRHLVYIGSANFTHKAWNGDNHELGLAWVEEGSEKALMARLVQAFPVEPICSYAGLPERQAPQSATEQDVLYTDDPGYPNFIERIELRRVDDARTVEFAFTTTTPEWLHDYDITWGDLRITVDGDHSQALPWQTSAMPLLSMHNLRFALHGQADAVFHLPYYHAPELLEYSDLYLYANPQDWMRHYQQGDRGGGKGGDEHIPGDPPIPPDGARDDVDREKNVVIAMQHHLSLFADVEREFQQRVEDIAQLPDRDVQWARRVEAPLLLYAKLLDQEHATAASPMRDQVYGFKLGELALFCNSLRDVMPEMKALARRLAKGLPAHRSAPPVLKTYLDYCRNELK